MLAACAQAPVRVPEPPVARYWPALPEQPRYVHEGAIRDSDSIRLATADDRMRQLFTGTDATRIGVRKPLAVAARGGRIYVTDTEGRRVVVFDVPRRRTFVIGYRLEGELRKPAGIAIDGQWRLYVADVSARRVVMYDSLGLFLGSFGGPSDLVRPVAVGVNRADDRIYVVDAGGVDEGERHRIVVYDDKGTRVNVFGRRGKAHGEFNLPVDAAVSADGRVHVLDAGNFRVQTFTPEGAFLGAFGAAGDGPGQFSRPRGLAVDAGGNVYVTDAGFGNVQVFDSAGRLLLAIGSRAGTDGPGHFLLPGGIATDETGRVYVVDQYFHKIEVLRHLPDDEGRRLLASGG